jgi:hypothetical protein
LLFDPRDRRERFSDPSHTARQLHPVPLFPFEIGILNAIKHKVGEGEKRIADIARLDTISME